MERIISFRLNPNSGEYLYKTEDMNWGTEMHQSVAAVLEYIYGVSVTTKYKKCLIIIGEDRGWKWVGRQCGDIVFHSSCFSRSFQVCPDQFEEVFPGVLDGKTTISIEVLELMKGV